MLGGSAAMLVQANPFNAQGSGTLREYLRAEARQGGTTAATQAFLHGPHGQKRTAEPAATEVAQQQPAAKCARTASEGQGGLEQQAHCGVVAQQPAEAALAPGCGLRPVTVERLSRHFEEVLSKANCCAFSVFVSAGWHPDPEYTEERLLSWLPLLFRKAIEGGYPKVVPSTVEGIRRVVEFAITATGKEKEPASTVAEPQGSPAAQLPARQQAAQQADSGVTVRVVQAAEQQAVQQPAAAAAPLQQQVNLRWVQASGPGGVQHPSRASAQPPAAGAEVPRARQVALAEGQQQRTLQQLVQAHGRDAPLRAASVPAQHPWQHWDRYVQRPPELVAAARSAGVVVERPVARSVAASQTPAAGHASQEAAVDGGGRGVQHGQGSGQPTPGQAMATHGTQPRKQRPGSVYGSQREEASFPAATRGKASQDPLLPATLAAQQQRLLVQQTTQQQQGLPQAALQPQQQVQGALAASAAQLGPRAKSMAVGQAQQTQQQQQQVGTPSQDRVAAQLVAPGVHAPGGSGTRDFKEAVAAAVDAYWQQREAGGEGIEGFSDEHLQGAAANLRIMLTEAELQQLAMSQATLLASMKWLARLQLDIERTMKAAGERIAQHLQGTVEDSQLSAQGRDAATAAPAAGGGPRRAAGSPAAAAAAAKAATSTAAAAAAASKPSCQPAAGPDAEVSMTPQAERRVTLPAPVLQQELQLLLLQCLREQESGDGQLRTVKVNNFECAMIQLHRLQPSLLAQYESFLASRLANGCCNGHLVAAAAGQEQNGRAAGALGGSQPAQQGESGAADAEGPCGHGSTEQQKQQQREQVRQSRQPQQQEQGQCGCEGLRGTQPAGTGVQMKGPQPGGDSGEDKWLSLCGRLQAQKERMAALRCGNAGGPAVLQAQIN